MLMRVLLRTKEKGYKDQALVTMFLPVALKMTAEFGTTLSFDPNSIHGDWPCIHGLWDQEDVFGIVSYDEDENHVFITWNDGDETIVDLKDRMGLMSGRLLTFHSLTHKTTPVMEIVSVESLS